MASADDLADEFRELDDTLIDDVGESTHDSLQETQRVADGLIRSKDIEASGDLRRSGHIVPNDRGGYTLKYGLHALFVEMGTGVYFRSPSVSAENFGPYDAPSLGENLIRGIREWIDDEGVTPDTVSTKDELAFAVAVNITKTGTPRQPFAGPAWFATKPKIVNGAKRQFSKSVDDM